MEIKTTEKKTTSDIIANNIQREAIFSLERHVFGSKEQYFAFRESGKPFPSEYRAAKNFILNYPWGTEEFFKKFIAEIPKLENSVGYDLTKKFVEKEYKNEFSDYDTHSRNPKSYITYKLRVTIFQSRLKHHNLKEDEIKTRVDAYTESYNRRFETNFKPYYTQTRK